MAACEASELHILGRKRANRSPGVIFLSAGTDAAVVPLRGNHMLFGIWRQEAGLCAALFIGFCPPTSAQRMLDGG